MYLFKYEIYGFDKTAFVDTGIIHGNNIGEAASFLAEYYGDTIEELKIDNYYICDDFPKEWKNSTLRQLDLSDTRKQLIKKYSSFIKGDSSSWLYIFGNHKVGKSFIAVTFANEFIRLFKKNVAVVSTPNLFRYLSDIYYKDKEKFNKIFDLLSNVDFLILDDFGNEYKNEFSRDNITIPLLSNRSNKEVEI